MHIPNEYSEAYQIVDTINLAHVQGAFRIEILRVLKGRESDFHAHYYERKADIWQRMGDVGTVDTRENQDAATQQALGFLASHLKKRNAKG